MDNGWRRHKVGPLRERPEYECWRTMIRRCTNANHPSFASYGARGIRVCKRWHESFDAFVEDIGPRPSMNHSIDRIDNDGHYEPGNVRWATRREQCLNQPGHNHIVTIDGESLSVTEWAERAGISPSTATR